MARLFILVLGWWCVEPEVAGVIFQGDLVFGAVLS